MNLRLLLYPFAIAYGLIAWLRNLLFDFKIFSSVKFTIPVINVGNLSVGGTGKTPHVEYLIRLLKDDFKVAVLSRGYGRTTKGFIEVAATNLPGQVGDEPLQYKLKFDSLTVAVDEKRANGIEQLQQDKSTQLVLLDDAYQHRYVKPGLTILLTEYDRPFFNDHLLPAGNLREMRSGYQRADIIIATKCPEELSETRRLYFINKIKPGPGQEVLFSMLKYDKPVSFNGQSSHALTMANSSVLLVTGIANALPLKIYIQREYLLANHLEYSDHHSFTINDVQAIAKKFATIAAKAKTIITTEKDFVRLKALPLSNEIKELPWYYIPVSVKFNDSDKLLFESLILKYVRQNKTNG